MVKPPKAEVKLAPAEPRMSVAEPVAAPVPDAAPLMNVSGVIRYSGEWTYTGAVSEVVGTDLPAAEHAEASRPTASLS